MINITGKDNNFKATFNPSTQEYIVYYKARVIARNKFKFSDIKSYLN